ncbi:MAG TPA: dihydropteroate synthase [Streptosporangiaceae bacterium]|nr:dihydropteroate synthase [Streptosporangiaceae bacterium]
MAIINRTPDSFYDRGKTFGLPQTIDAIEENIATGADWLDIGAVPNKATAPEVSQQEELDRLLPAIQAARERTDAVISAETYNAEVARQALQAGADVINDVSGLHDLSLAEIVAEANGSLIITHRLAHPRTPVPNPHYDDVVSEVSAFLRKRASQAIGRGLAADRIILDPAHDLNKDTYQSLELTRRLSEIAAIGYPVLAAVSNKDFIGQTLDRPLENRLEGTIATVSVCIMQGARIVRVHNVREVLPAVRMVEALLGWRHPAAPKPKPH